MTYMDEWEYHLYLELHRNDKTALLPTDQTDSGEKEFKSIVGPKDNFRKTIPTLDQITDRQDS